MITISNVTLAWRDRGEGRPAFNLYAGSLRIGEVTKYLGERMAEKPWEARFFGDGMSGTGTFHPTEPDAKAALELSAIKALGGKV